MSRLITAEDIAAFAELSGDHYLLHSDADFASRTRFGAPIAHGLLTAAAASGLLFSKGVIGEGVEALLEVNLRFVGPVYPGDEIDDETRLVDSRVTESGATIERYEMLLRGRDDALVLRAEWLLLRSAPWSGSTGD